MEDMMMKKGSVKAPFFKIVERRKIAPAGEMGSCMNPIEIGFTKSVI